MQIEWESDIGKFRWIMSRSMRLLLLQRSFSDHIRSSTSKALDMLSKPTREAHLAGEWQKHVRVVAGSVCTSFLLVTFFLTVCIYECLDTKHTPVVYHLKDDAQHYDKNALSLS